ncbi:MAG: hypothetical protein F6K31_25910, partial [Symploca sp. SIO2G7]|nr:hypothetical protein [Symploca sp. SIO2G7]
KTTVTVTIPRNNLFTPEAISKLMQKEAKDRARLLDTDNFSLEEQIKDDSI